MIIVLLMNEYPLSTKIVLVFGDDRFTASGLRIIFEFNLRHIIEDLVDFLGRLVEELT